MFTKIKDVTIDFYYLHRIWFYVIVIAIFLLFLLIFTKVNSLSKGINGDEDGLPKQHTTEVLSYLDKQKGIQSKMFSGLSYREQGEDNRIAIENSLYLKKPFEEAEEIEKNIRNMAKSIHAKYNGSGKELMAIRIKVYDRKVAFDKGLNPRGEYYYLPKADEIYERLVSEAEEEAEEVNEDRNDEVEQESSNTILRKYGKKRQDIIYNYLLEETDEKLPKKTSDYHVETSKPVETFDMDEGKEPLSDEEYAFYTKLKLYESITGNRSGSIRTFLRWDMGLDLNDSATNLLYDKFNEFMDRQDEALSGDDLLPNKTTLESQLVLKRPQFFVFVKYDELESDFYKAQKKIVEKDESKYKKIIEDDINKKASVKTKEKTNKETDEYEKLFDYTIGEHAEKKGSKDSKKLKEVE